MFERPIQNGQCIDSTPQDIRLMRYRAHVLHALLEGFVQRRSHSVLQISLPRKEEYILLVRMTAHQRKLYDTFMNQVVKTRAVPNPLKAFAVCCKIWNHPDILYHFLRKRQANEEDDLDLEETMGDKAPNTPGAKRATKARQPKGEGKKGKKANMKNKPAASIQPNSTTMLSENTEVDGEKQQSFQNFNAPAPPQHPPIVNNTNFSHANSQGSYQQQHHQLQQQHQQQHPQQQQQQHQHQHQPAWKLSELPSR
jgi:RAD54-like protein 2